MSTIFGHGAVVPRRGVLAQLVAIEPAHGRSETWPGVTALAARWLPHRRTMVQRWQGPQECPRRCRLAALQSNHAVLGGCVNAGRPIEA
jgi:hypothetical protein